MIVVKRCSMCRAYSPAENFARDRSRADGRKTVCKPCRNDRRRELYHGAKRARPWGRQLESR